MTLSTDRHINIHELTDRFKTLFLDAYGVLVSGNAALPDAKGLLGALRQRQQEYFIVTNGSSRSLEGTARHYQSLGLDIPTERVINSGMLLSDYFAEYKLAGSQVAVLGTQDSAQYARDAGGEVVPLAVGQKFDVLVVANQTDYPFLPTIETVLTQLFHQVDEGKVPHLILPNPDLIYPRGLKEFGFTSGAVAMMFEQALAARYGQHGELTFTRLGKPYPAIFQKALSLAGTRDVVMIGDQLETDIAGAKNAGIAAALYTGGMVHPKQLGHATIQPDFILESLAWHS